MAYVAVKGGERAIDAAHAWLAEERRGDPAVPALGSAQIAEQLGRAVDRVMARRLAATTASWPRSRSSRRRAT